MDTLSYPQGLDFSKNPKKSLPQPDRNSPDTEYWKHCLNPRHPRNDSFLKLGLYQNPNIEPS